MNGEPAISIHRINTVEVHYWFTDDSHLMDAYVQNKCEYEFLGILKEICSTFNVELVVETQPLQNGGLRRWFRLTSKEEDKKATITIALITALLTTIIVTPLSTTISKVTERAIDKLFEDSVMQSLEKEKLRLEVENLRLEVREKTEKLDTSNVIKKKKSNFYVTLDNYQKIDKVSYSYSHEHEEVLEEKIIQRNDFKKFILVTDELEPIHEDEIVIEIISPVLKKGNYKWMGIYNGEAVPFTMKSKEFKELVQLGQVQFKNGTSINCSAIIKRKIDNEGIERITNIEVNRVNHYFENDKPIETYEGRLHRKKKEAERKQYNLFKGNTEAE